jgi:transcriptional regulator with XRE-family HTH domain
MISIRGNIVEEQRINTGYSKEEFCKLLDLSLQNYEKLKKNRLDIDKTLEYKLALALHCPISFLKGITTSSSNQDLIISIKENLDKLKGTELAVINSIVHDFLDLVHKSNPESEPMTPLDEVLKESIPEEDLFLKRVSYIIQTLRLEK